MSKYLKLWTLESFLSSICITCYYLSQYLHTKTDKELIVSHPQKFFSWRNLKIHPQTSSKSALILVFQFSKMFLKWISQLSLFAARDHFVVYSWFSGSTPAEINLICTFFYHIVWLKSVLNKIGSDLYPLNIFTCHFLY